MRIYWFDQKNRTIVWRIAFELLVSVKEDDGTSDDEDGDLSDGDVGYDAP